jgi:erythromycin esterase-like protein
MRGAGDGQVRLLAAAQSTARAYTGSAADIAHVLGPSVDTQVFLIGEASHGTEEFYFLRAEITKHLIEHRGLSAVAVEADWPDAYRVNRYVRGEGSDPDADSALQGFERFPTWMWRNTEVHAFVRWLRDWNNAHRDRQVGFYGLDLYSLMTSIQAVVAYLDAIDPAAARRARERYACFDQAACDTQAYGYGVSRGQIESCEDEVVGQLIDLRRRAAEYVSRDGLVAEEAFFVAEQNARLAINAEHYYRAMFRGRHSSWNIRDTHMADTFDALRQFLGRRGASPSIAVWAHNSHLGDARATEMGAAGEINLGQLLRQRHGGAVRSIGFTTYDGFVTAASDWDRDVERKRVRPALAGSVEYLLHGVGLPQFALDLHDHRLTGFQTPLLERAIGVIYRPDTERQSHYFHARVAEQFDALIHVDRSNALVPLEPAARWHHDEVPETYPSGF